MSSFLSSSYGRSRPALVLSLAALWLSSCGATTVRTDRTEGLPERCEGACREGDVCQNGFALRCECALHYDPQCGGAERILDPPTWQWSCGPSDPTSDRGDGCPFAQPAEGAACSEERTCRYPSVCGWHGQDATCATGIWHVAPFMTDPPA
jgi:hypothetical protein